MQLVRTFRETTRKYPQKAAYVFEKREYLYGEVETRANQLANRLLELGIRKGDRIGLLMHNIPDFAIAYYGVLSIGASVVPLNTMCRPREITYMVNNCGAKAIIAAGPYLPTVLQARSSTPSVQYVIVKARGSVPHTLDFDTLLAGASSEPVPVSLSEEDTAVICYTSGATGDPKGAVHTHGSLLAGIDQLLSAPRFHVTADDVALLAQPLFHICGINAGLNLCLRLGMTGVMVERFDAEAAARLIQDHRISVFFGFPSMFVALVRLPTISYFNLGSLRLACSSGAMLPVWALEAFRKLAGTDIMECYSLTEASPVIASNASGPVTKPGSVGPALPGVEIKLVDEYGNEVPRGQRGEVVCRGPSVVREYFNLPEENERSFRGGWFHTSDIATMDEDHYYYVVSRKTEMIKVGGFTVYPREIEDCLIRHPKVKEAAAVGVPDPYQGEAVVTVVVLWPTQTATEEEIIDYCREHLAAFKVPQRVEFRESLPKSAAGKLQKRLLREEMAQAAGTSPLDSSRSF